MAGGRSYDAVIVGAGVIGAAVSYYLAKEGIRDVLILDKGYVSGGATGRCGAGVRQQWGLEMNCRLAKQSVDMFVGLSEELGEDIEFEQSGYLVLAYDSETVELYEHNIELQNPLGIPARLVTPEEAREIVPVLNTDGLLAATYCPTDGHANPFKTNYAYANAAERLGCELHTFEEVTAIETGGSGIRAVVTDKERYETRVVVNCAGGHAARIAELAGIEIDCFPERHQILVTEPYERLFDPMVISFAHHLYCQQVVHGSFIMGLGMPEEPGFNEDSGWEFIEAMARAVTSILPILAGVRVIRQWAGFYTKTPDAQPILGEHPDLPGFYNAVGFSGHGFMIGPATAKLVAEAVACGYTPELIKPLDAKRFERGDLILEPNVV
ncbi:FAD-binding oxidoreductase [bacterium]|nr:FAD-binding oxidoreductase [bacterium]